MSGVPTIAYPCAFCSQPTSLWCSRCQNAWYCSPEHIHDDWPRHRQNCRPAVLSPQAHLNTNVAPPPVEPELVTFSAIYFAPSEERPKTVFVECRLPPKGSGNPCPTPILDEFFGDNLMEFILLTQGLNGDPLRCPLQLWYSPTLLSEPGAPPNRAIFHITAGAAEKHWTGPLVVLKHNGTRRQGYCDASSNDLPALSAYFLAYK